MNTTSYISLLDESKVVVNKVCLIISIAFDSIYTKNPNSCPFFFASLTNTVFRVLVVGTALFPIFKT